MTGRPSQLVRLAQPFPDRYVHEVDGERCVPHGVVMQWLLGILGRPRPAPAPCLAASSRSGGS